MVKSLRFADDKTVLVSCEKVIQEMMDNINIVTKDYGMKENVENTKCISHKAESRLKI